MIGSVTGVGSYAAAPSVQRYAPEKTKAIHDSLSAVHAPSVQQATVPTAAETPVTPVATVKAVKSDGAENLRMDNAVNGESYAAEASARMRVSTTAEEEESSPVKELEEKETRRKEQLEAEKKAEEKKEAYLEELKAEEQARAERIEALKEAQSSEEEGEKDEDTHGTLELDHTAAMMRNYQMNNLMQEMITARAGGKETSQYSAAIEALLDSSASQLRYHSGEEESGAAAQRKQQAAQVNRTPFAAVA